MYLFRVHVIFVVLFNFNLYCGRDLCFSASVLQLYRHMTPLELLALFIAALCHDLDHPGEILYTRSTVVIFAKIHVHVHVGNDRLYHYFTYTYMCMYA